MTNAFHLLLNWHESTGEGGKKVGRREKRLRFSRSRGDAFLRPVKRRTSFTWCRWGLREIFARDVCHSGQNQKMLEKGATSDFLKTLQLFVSHDSNRTLDTLMGSNRWTLFTAPLFDLISLKLHFLKALSLIRLAVEYFLYVLPDCCHQI